jgi:hypothetical protein
LNSYTLLIPDGEQFVKRAIEPFVGAVAPALRRQVGGLFGQEIAHSVQHARYWDNLRAQGFAIDRFLRVYRTLCFRVVEPMLWPRLKLSVAAGTEHLNAFIAEIGLEDELLAGADPELRALFEWHYAEEIEHKEVAYDVLAQIAPSYPLRIAGLLLATSNFLVFLGAGTAWLLAAEGQLARRSTLADTARFLFTRERFVPRLLRAMAAYARPNFHPRQVPNEHLAERVFARLDAGGSR